MYLFCILYCCKRDSDDAFHSTNSGEMYPFSINTRPFRIIYYIPHLNVLRPLKFRKNQLLNLLDCLGFSYQDTRSDFLHSALPHIVLLHI